MSNATTGWLRRRNRETGNQLWKAKVEGSTGVRTWQHAASNLSSCAVQDDRPLTDGDAGFERAVSRPDRIGGVAGKTVAMNQLRMKRAGSGEPQKSKDQEGAKAFHDVARFWRVHVERKRGAGLRSRPRRVSFYPIVWSFTPELLAQAIEPGRLIRRERQPIEIPILGRQIEDKIPECIRPDCWTEFQEVVRR